MYIVLVADGSDVHGYADPRVVGPFFDEREALDYAYGVERRVVQVLAITSPAHAVGVR